MTAPADRVAQTFDALDALAGDDPAVFLAVAAREATVEAAAAIDPSLPLAGLTVAVKDNIDVAGLPTTAACAAYSYVPERSAPVVDRLVAAGATIVGKTNLDQFATGLVGTRSPYGVPRNPLDARLAPGGSSSGSAVAVARGVVDVALGTDTAGSGRVPAAQCRIVGIKPTCGRLSTSGVVPAVRSIDCVSIFARDVATAWRAFVAADGFDASDPYARRAPLARAVRPTTIGVPVKTDHDSEADRAAFAAGLERLAALGHELVEVDIEPLLAAGRLLYGGPWVAERHVIAGETLAAHPEAADPTVARIVGGAAGLTAMDAYRGAYELAALRRAAEGIWEQVGLLVIPTTPGPATLEEIAADPIGRNNRLGLYTTFANLLDTCVASVPGPDRPDGWPTGLSVVGPAWADEEVVALAARLNGEDVVPAPLGATFDLVVVGAHLSGQPLNWQLTSIGATLLSRQHTAPTYRLYALANTTPPKPGLVRVAEGGAAIEVERWQVPSTGVGTFLAQVPAPLAIGTLELDDGSTAHGFVCEPRALEGATDITHHGGWRAYLASRG